MPGLLQTAGPKPKSNPMLDHIVQQAEAQVPANLKNQFLAVMTIGGKLMWSDQMANERAAFDRILQQSGNVPEVVAHTVLKTISVIQNESKQDKPLDAVGLAAPIFMAYILQYVESRHGIPITKDIIDQTAQLLQVNLLRMYGVTDAHIQELLKMRAQGRPMQPSATGRADQAAAGQASDEEAAEGTPTQPDSAQEETDEEQA